MSRPADDVRDAYLAAILKRMEELEHRVRQLELKVVYIRRPDTPTRPASPSRPSVSKDG